jgi:hypothetical protein
MDGSELRVYRESRGVDPTTVYTETATVMIRDIILVGRDVRRVCCSFGYRFAFSLTFQYPFYWV